MEILLIYAVINIRVCQSITNLNKVHLEIMATKLLEIYTSPFVSGTRRKKNVFYEVDPLVSYVEIQICYQAETQTSNENEKY
jgi:hypothetical protein